MKTIAELEAIREKAIQKVNLRNDRKNGIRVVVGMATCGLAAGARPVMNAFVEEVNRRKLQDVTVAQTGCIGVCRLEPIVEIYMPGEEKVTYVKMTPEKAVQIVNEHIVNGNACIQYTIGTEEK